MPYITIEGGSLDKDQKSELIKRITQVASEIMHIPEEFFFITIKELSDDNIGIGGKSIEVIKRNYSAQVSGKQE